MELKPCPFCGNKVKLTSESYDAYAGNYYTNTLLKIRCGKCAYDMRVYPESLGCTDKERDKLIKKWNKRAYEQTEE